MEELCRIEPDNKKFLWRLESFLTSTAGPTMVRRRIDCLNKIIALDPMEKLAYNELAYDYYALGEKQKSEQAVDYYRRLAPLDANIYDTRGDLYAYEGDVENARRSYQAAIEIDSGYASSWGKMGRAYMRMGDEAAARRCWEKASSFGSYARTAAHYDIAVLPLYRGRGAEAMATLQHALDAEKISGDDNVVVRQQLLYLTYLRRKSGQTASTDHELARAFDHYSSNPGLNTQAVLLFAELGTPHLDEYLQRIEQSTGSGSLRSVISKTWIEMSAGRYASAVAVVDTMIASGDRFVLAYTQGVAYLRAERWADAVAKLERCRGMFDAGSIPMPHFYVRTHLYLAQAYEGAGQPDKAIREYEAFIDAWKDADATFSGEVADARRQLERLRAAPRRT